MEGLSHRSGIAIDLQVSGDFGRLPTDIELALFRVVQECMTNIHRHSSSKTAELRLSRAADKVQIEVRDQGHGIPSNKMGAVYGQRSGVGIAGMRERVRHLKGEMNIDSTEQGTRVCIALPLTGDDREPVQP